MFIVEQRISIVVRLRFRGHGAIALVAVSVSVAFPILFRLGGGANSLPTLIIELRRVNDSAGLSAGTLHLEDFARQT